jgi:uncharacterized protein (DUF2267 family)
MPMPCTYRQATREWQAFLADAREAMNLTSDNATYTAVQGVLQTFRRRLTPQQAVDFSQVLPSVLRALFVADWHLADPIPPGTRADWTAEAKALRPHHNLTPDNCVAATALALRKSILRADLEAVMATLPAFAAAFWDVPGIDTATLGPRIV